MERQKGSRWGEIIIKTVLTGGVWAIFKLSSMAPSHFRTAWVERAGYILSTDRQKSPWPWIRKAWIASFLGLFTLEICALSYFSIASFLFRGQQLVNAHGMPLALAFWITLPVLVAHLAYFGHVFILLGHTLWPSRIVAYIQTRIETLKGSFHFGSRSVNRSC